MFLVEPVEDPPLWFTAGPAEPWVDPLAAGSGSMGTDLVADHLRPKQPGLVAPSPMMEMEPKGVPWESAR